jgi:hypothetical protein
VKRPHAGEHHHTAAFGVDVWLRAGAVERHPAYLVGVVVHEHKGGPAKVATLVLHDGTLLGAIGERMSIDSGRLIDLFPFDAYDSEDVDRHTKHWRKELGGFGGFSRFGPTTVAEVVKTCIASGSQRWLDTLWRFYEAGIERFSNDEVRDELGTHDILGQTQASVLALDGCVADVVGVAFSEPQLTAWQVVDWLKTELLVTPPADDDPVEQARDAIADKLDAEVSDLYNKFLTVRGIDGRAGVALLRTAAEIVLAKLNPDLTQRRFSERVDELERSWDGTQVATPLAGDPRPEAFRRSAWRYGVLAALHTVRDIGNEVHSSTDLPPSRVEACRNAFVALVEHAVRLDTWSGSDF